MAKSKYIYTCNQCGFESTKWNGKCPSCGAWNSFEEDIADAESNESLEDDADVQEDFEEDDVNIDVDNNIVNHLIAECDNCKGIFISAMIASEQEVDSINGICPLCNKETTQMLKWIIKDYPE